MKLRTTQQGVQQQVFAQALQQSLKILQMPLLELKALLEQELESNPVLEEGSPGLEDQVVDELIRISHREGSSMSDWESVSGGDEEDSTDPLAAIAQPPPTLVDVLLQQVQSHALPRQMLQAAEVIIGSLDEAGYLRDSLEELAGYTDIPLVVLEQVLGVIQGCEPAGVGARSLEECLLLQLKAKGLQDSLAALLIKNGTLEQLAQRNYSRLAAQLKVSQEEVEAAARLIASLAPKPGHLLPSGMPASSIVPDLLITKRGDGKFSVIFRDDELPPVKISQTYRKMLNDPRVAEDVRDYVRERIQAALGVLRGIQQRQQTMHRLAEAIIQLQPVFLQHGLGALRPMTYRQMAEAIRRHPSTVARAVAQKYLECPAGVFALSELFSASVASLEGDNVSAQTARVLLKDLVAEEDRRHPLSDETLVEKLQSQGILVARRTVAKYRQQLRIPAAHQRRLK